MCGLGFQSGWLVGLHFLDVVCEASAQGSQVLQ
jgi:hypothetical protein